jgi:hypothetical protein
MAASGGPVQLRHVPPLVKRHPGPAECRTYPLQLVGSPLWSADAAVTAAPAVSVYG